MYPSDELAWRPGEWGALGGAAASGDRARPLSSGQAAVCPPPGALLAPGPLLH